MKGRHLERSQQGLAGNKGRPQKEEAESNEVVRCREGDKEPSSGTAVLCKS